MVIYTLVTGDWSGDAIIVAGSVGSWCVGMADEADSKSVVGNHVWVQVPPPAVLKKLGSLVK
mgnify:CR=1 FL=1